MTRSELEIVIKKRAAITVTAFAALLAVNTMLGNANSSRVLTNTIQANNVWAWYQAKNIRSVLNTAMADMVESDDMTKKDAQLVQHFRSEVQRLRNDPQDGMIVLSDKAKALEAERDKAKERSPYYTYAGSALQLGIVLSTAAILAVTMPLFWASVAVGGVGAALMAFAYYGV
jgi:hypothetical protein